MRRLTAEELAEIRDGDAMGYSFYDQDSIPFEFGEHRRKLLAEFDALTAERDKLAAALKVAEAERDAAKALAPIAEARAEGFREGVEACAALLGDKYDDCTGELASEAIRKLQPPGGEG